MVESRSTLALREARPALVVKQRLAYTHSWVRWTGTFAFATALTVMLSQTTYLSETTSVDAVRWVLLALLCLMTLIRPRNMLQLRRPITADGVFAFFICLAATSALYSDAQSLTLQRTISAGLLYISIFWTLWFYADVVGGERLVLLLLRAATLIFGAGLINIFVSPDSWLDGRYRGLLANPNAVGMLGILFLPLAVARYLKTRRASSFWQIVLIALSIVLSGSRNGVLTASLATTYLLFRSRSWRAGFTIGVLGSLIYALMTYAPSGEMLQQPELQRLIPSDKALTGGGRVEAWEVAIPIIQKKLLFGHGFGTEDLIYKGMRFRIHRGGYIHNSYLGLTYQLGVIGALLLFGPLLWLLGARLFRAQVPSWEAWSYESVLVGGLIASFFESWIYSAGNAFAFSFWTCVMLLARVSYRGSDFGAIVYRPKPKAPIKLPVSYINAGPRLPVVRIHDTTTTDRILPCSDGAGREAEGRSGKSQDSSPTRDSATSSAVRPSKSHPP